MTAVNVSGCQFVVICLKMQEFFNVTQKYFTQTEWDALSHLQKCEYARICYVYYACMELGIIVVTPDYMQRIKNGALQNLPFSCEICNESFLLKEECEKHLKKCRKKKIRSTVKRHFCQLCDYSAHCLSQLHRHQITHTQIKLFSCHLCPKDFRSKQRLNDHISAKHSTKEEQFKCTNCAYATHVKKNFTSHMKIHNKVKLHICPICSKSFNHKSNLNTHLYTHKDEKPFKCSFCPKGYLQKSKLTQHINAVHLKLKQFQCEHQNCDYKTARKADFKTHSYVHMKNKPYKCLYCRFQSCTKDNLNRHVATMH